MLVKVYIVSKRKMILRNEKQILFKQLKHGRKAPYTIF